MDDLSKIKNKNVRSLMYQKLKKEKLKVKKKQKLENKDKPKQAPKTIENCRIIDDTYLKDLENDTEVQLDLQNDEISRHMRRSELLLKEKNKKKEEEDECKLEEDEEDEDEEKSTDPKILITTNNLKISLKTYKLCRELSRVLPNANYFYRKNVNLKKVIPQAIERDYSAMIVINEDRKIPSKFLLLFLIFKRSKKNKI